MTSVQNRVPIEEIKLLSIEDTEQYAQTLSRKIKPGSVIALVGDLGAGKTTFTQCFCRALGVSEYVTSPSFNLMNAYKGFHLEAPIDIYHFDVYRIGSPEEMDEIGFEEFLYGSGVCIVEWATLVADQMPEDTIWIAMTLDETFTRTLTLYGPIQGNEGT